MKEREGNKGIERGDQESDLSEQGKETLLLSVNRPKK